MSDIQHKKEEPSFSNVPKKGDIIINPRTQRPVKVGSRTWLNLVKQGLVSGHYTDPRELAVIEDGENVEEKINEINKTLPRGKQSVRGRGKYKGKIVSRNTQPSAEEISRYTAQIASRAVNNNIEELAECDDLEGMLEKMIMEEMMATRPATAPPVVRRVGKPKKPNDWHTNNSNDDAKYEVTIQEEEEEDDEDPNDCSGYNNSDYEFNDYQFDEEDFE